MAKRNINDAEHKSRYEPIEIEGFAGRDWVIGAISDEMAGKILTFSKAISADEDGLTPKKVNDFLGIVFNEPTDTFVPVDWRSKQDVVSFIMANINLTATDQSAEGKDLAPDTDQ